MRDRPAPATGDAWAFVVDHGTEIERIRFEPQGPQGPGVLNHLSRGRRGGRTKRVRAVSRTVPWEPPVRCEFESVTPRWPVTAHITEDFEAAGPGTRHRIVYEVVPVGIVGVVVSPLLSRVMERSRRGCQQRMRGALCRLDGSASTSTGS